MDWVTLYIFKCLNRRSRLHFCRIDTLERKSLSNLSPSGRPSAQVNSKNQLYALITVGKLQIGLGRAQKNPLFSLSALSFSAFCGRRWFCAVRPRSKAAHGFVCFACGARFSTRSRSPRARFPGRWNLLNALDCKRMRVSFSQWIIWQAGGFRAGAVVMCVARPGSPWPPMGLFEGHQTA